MATENHIIKRQVLDLTLESEVGSFTFQNKVSEIFKTAILPMIDNYCNRIGRNSETIRIDKLEINLGVVNKSTFETDFKQKFDKLFPEQLNKTLGTPREEGSSISDSASTGNSTILTEEGRDFKILEFFIREGRLPWWVSRNEFYDISALLTRIIVSQPAKVKKLIAEIVKYPALVKRLVYHVRESAFEKIIAFFRPEAARAIYNLSQDLVTGLTGGPLVQSGGPSKIKPELWSGVLLWSVTSEGQAFKRQYFIEAIVKQLAESFDTDFNTLYGYLSKTLKANGMDVSNKPVSPQFTKKIHGIVDFKTKEYIQHLFDGLARRLTNGMELMQQLKKMVAKPSVSNSKFGKHMEKFEKWMGGLSFVQQIKNSVLSSFGPGLKLRKGAGKLEESIKKLRLDLVNVLQKDIAEMDCDIVKVKSLVNGIDGLKEATVAQKQSTAVDVFGLQEEMYVANAGIVLLWPYLAKFFDALGLAKEERFINDEAAGRAALFLHYLASSEVTAQEHELVLNKILCGLEPDYPVNPNLELTKAEATECENLLQAVIQNWPVLKNVSGQGLRSLFLMREGMIFMRDGYRVLRAAGQSYDILLDKMPWGIGTIKLPWMGQLLFVEWRQ